ncbi:MAG: cellulose biosynthesis cyclic di-GMP-binding regulatory protein BcsB, partial [Clostridiales bacterium]|nr:cellulose biosynthesis cyclic di-GMP-binding regulatory protein BcsB [Clostridiales bacterium]
MKKIKILSLVFALVFAVSALFGCKKENNSSLDDTKLPYEKSGYLLVDHGTSEYVVLLPQNPSENEYTAANELTYFLGEATQANIAIVNEGSYNVFENSAVISIGDTVYADQRGVKTDGSLDTSGYIMKTIDNQL